MRLLRVEVGVAIRQRGRVAAVHVRVEIAYARARYPHAVVHADVHARREAIAQARAWHEHAIVFLEVVAAAQLVFHVLPGVFIPASHHRTKLSPLRLPLSVSGEYALRVLVFHAVARVERLRAVAGHVVILRVGLVEPVDELGSEVEGVLSAERLREVGLQGVLRGARRVVGAQVVELHARHAARLVVESVVVGVRERVVEEIAQYHVALAVVVPEPLVVHAAVKRLRARLLPHLVAVRESLSVYSAIHPRGRLAVYLLLESDIVCHGTNGAERVEVIAQAYVAHGVRLLHVRLLVIRHVAVGIGSRDLRPTSLYLLHTVEVYRRAVHALVVEHAVGAVGQLALLPVYQRRHAPYLVAACHAHVAVVAIGHVAARGTAPLVEHNVEHATRAFRVVFRPGVGHDLNALHHRGGHGLEYLRGVAGVHGVELAVYIHLEARRAVHGDVVLSVHGHPWHLPQHVEHGGGLRLGVVGHVVGHLVGLHLDERLRRHHAHRAEVNILPNGIVLELVASVFGCIARLRHAVDSASEQRAKQYDVFLFHVMRFFLLSTRLS